LIEEYVHPEKTDSPKKILKTQKSTVHEVLEKKDGKKEKVRSDKGIVQMNRQTTFR